MPINCFVSHSHRDKPFEDRLADTLAAHGVETWYSARSVVIRKDAIAPVITVK